MAGTEVFGSRDRETESEHLDSEKEGAIKPERSLAQDFDAKGADPRDRARTQDLGCHRDQAADETRHVSGTTAFTRPVQTETTAGTSAGLAACQGLKSPHSFSRPGSARQRRSGKSGHGMSNPLLREEPLWTHRACRPEVGLPKIPQTRLQVGPQSPHRWAQMSWDPEAREVQNRLRPWVQDTNYAPESLVSGRMVSRAGAPGGGNALG
jgi:hypothetical protein